MADPSVPDWATTPQAPSYSNSMTPQDYFGVVKSIYPNAVFHGGGRTSQHNASVGGVPDSMHLTDQALDFSVPGVPSSQVFNAIHKAGVPVSEQLDEGTHLHMGWSPSKPNINPNYSPQDSAPSWATGGGTPDAPPSWAAQQPQGHGLSDLVTGHTPSPSHGTSLLAGVEEGIAGLPNMPGFNPVHGVIDALQQTGVKVPGFLADAYDPEKLIENVGGALTGFNPRNIPSPTPTDRILRATGQGVGTAIIPGEAEVGAGRVALSAARNAIVGGVFGGASQGAVEVSPDWAKPIVGAAAGVPAAILAHKALDLGAARVMDAATAAKRNYDVNQNLSQSTNGAPVSDFVKGLFSTRGMDTTPAANPGGRTSPITQDHIQLSPEEQQAYQHVLMNGDVDDIHAFTQGRQGPQPSYEDINSWVSHRDSSPGKDVSEDTHLQPQPSEDAVNQYHRQNVEDHVNSQTANWQNAPKFEVVHNPEDIADPEARAHALATDTDPQGNKALGSYGKDGVVRMYSSRINSPELANSLIYHEGLGHFGLQQQFGEKLESTLTTLDKSNVGQFKKEVDARQADHPEESRTLSAEEVLAVRSQEGPLKKSWSDAVESVIRQYGRKMGLKLNYNDAEVRHILAMAHDSVINGVGRDASANGYRVGKAQPLVLGGETSSKKMYGGLKSSEFDMKNEDNFIAPDGHVRQEFSDKGAYLGYNKEGVAHHLQQGDEMRLGDYLHHPELYKHYPELADMKVAGVNTEGKLHGFYAPNTKTIGIDVNAPHPLETVLHEIQHAVQHIEGHSNGASSSVGRDEYNRTLGEVEARDTAWRRTMGDEGRHIIEPYSSQGIDRKDMIVTKPFQTRLEQRQSQVGERNALGEEKSNPDDLDEIERLKADPRFWADPEYRANVIEKIRSQGEIDPSREPEKTRYKYANEAEARAAQGAKFMRTDQAKALTRDDDYTGALEETARAYEAHVSEPMSFEDTKRAALNLGFSPSQIKDLGDIDGMHVKIARIGGALNAAKAKLSELNARLDTPNWSLADKGQYIKTVADFNYLMEKYLGHGSESGRMLNTIKQIGFTREILGNINDILKESGGDLSGLADDGTFQKYARAIKEQMDAGNDKAVQVQLKALVKPYREQYLTTLWHNMMLSSLATHFKSSLDMITGIGLDAQERLLSMPIGAVRKMVFGGQAGRTPQEALAYTYGVMRSIGNMEIARAAGHALATGEGAFVLPNKSRISTNQNTFGTIQNPRLTGLARPLNLPTDMIAAQDTVFRSQAMAGHLYDMGVQQATEELGKDSSFDDRATLGSSYAHNPTITMIKEAKALTDQTLLMNNNALNTIIDKGRIMTPGMSANQRAGAFLLNMVTPFIRVESNNFWSRFIMRSPIGWVDKMTRQQLMAGGKDADLAMARMTMGTLKMMFYWSAAGAAVGTAKQLLTTNGPTNPNLYKEKEAQGWSPNSVEENGQFNGSDGLNANVIPWDLHNNTASLVASARESYDLAANQHQAAIGAKLALGSIMHDMASQTWVHDFQPLIEAASDTDATAGQKSARVAASLAGNFFPNIVGQVARGGFGTLGGAGDPNKHDLNATDALGNADILGTVKNTLQARVPYLNQKLPIKYSVYGDPLQTGASATGVSIPGITGGSPSIRGNGTNAQTDPAKVEMQRLSALIQSQPVVPGQPKPGALITPVEKSVKLNDGSVKKLTSAEFENYQHLVGINIVAQVRAAMADPSWAQMDDNDKAWAIKDIQTGVKSDEREALFKNGQ